MSRPTDRPISPRDRLGAGLLLIASGSLSLYLLMHARWAAASLAPVCGHSGLFALHCPACYAAAAMIAAGLALALGATRRTLVLREQRLAKPR